MQEERSAKLGLTPREHFFVHGVFQGRKTELKKFIGRFADPQYINGILQEALATAWPRVEPGPPYNIRQFYPWFKSIVRHTAVSRLKDERRRAYPREADGDLFPQDNEVDFSQDAAVSADDVKRLRIAINRIEPEGARRALLMREFGGGSSDYIGKSLGVANERVGYLLVKAMHQLRVNYSDLNPNESKDVHSPNG